MSEQHTVGLTTEQRDLLIRGLRFMRSSISMELIDPYEDASAGREQRLQEVADLEARLGAVATSNNG
ncbi:hypothetical protein [Stratiformator vulcanicus]|nr:hypothetical protein [Stratiformator vulcanicus]